MVRHFFVGVMVTTSLVMMCGKTDTANQKANELREKFKSAVAIGAPRSEVIAFLKREKIEYYDDPQRHLVLASMPRLTKTVMGESGVYARFAFNDGDRLVSYEIAAGRTGL